MRALLQPLGWIVAMLIMALSCAALGMALNASGSGDAAKIAAVLAGIAALFQAVFAGVALFSIRYSRVAAEAANATLRHQQDTAVKQLRAYVSFDKIKVARFEPDEPLTYIVKLKNAGQSPALNLALRTRLYDATGDTEPMPWPFVRAARPDVLAPIAPGGYGLSNNTTSNRVSAEICEAVREGRSVVMLQIILTYDDVFGINRQSRTLVKYFLTPAGELKVGTVEGMED